MPKYDPQVVLDTMLATCAALGTAVDAMGDLAEKMRSEAFEKEVAALKYQVRMLHAKVVPKKIMFQQIVRAVCETAGVTQQSVMRRDRTSGPATARKMIMYLAYQRGMSTPQIGKFLDRDHTTVLAGIADIKRRIARHAQDGNDKTVQLIAQQQVIPVDYGDVSD